MAAYDFIDQNIVASCLIEPRTDDSFYYPVPNQHTGYAFNGNYYLAGVPQVGQYSSWFTEAFGPYRGSTAAFPTYGLVLLTPVSLAILDESLAVLTAQQLPLWMLFLLGDNLSTTPTTSNALPDNYNGTIQGFLPSAVCYADGVVSVTYSPDAGNQPSGQAGSPPAEPAQSHLVVSIDFVQDRVYLDVAL